MRSSLRIVHISDTHGRHGELGKLPAGDVLIHSGDVSCGGGVSEVESSLIDFLEWYTVLPYRYKLFIGGNHDDYLHDAVIGGLPADCYYLRGGGVMIDGWSFYGVSLYTQDISSGYHDVLIDGIPNDTDVLITHYPPYGILDYACVHHGDMMLLPRVLEVCPRYHLFGHVHGGYGMELSRRTTFVNGSLLDESMLLCNAPVVLEL